MASLLHHGLNIELPKLENWSVPEECCHRSRIEVSIYSNGLKKDCECVHGQTDRLSSMSVYFITFVAGLIPGLRIVEVAHDIQLAVSKLVTNELHLLNSFDTWHGMNTYFFKCVWLK